MYGDDHDLDDATRLAVESRMRVLAAVLRDRIMRPMEPCPTCAGRGHHFGATGSFAPCRECGGGGEVTHGRG